MRRLLIFYILLLLFSCGKKNNSTPPVPKTKYDLLINKKWKVSGESGTSNGVFYPDVFSALPDWAKDEYFFFYDNLNYEENAGPLKQPGFTDQILDHGTWQLTTSDKFITLTSVVAGQSSGSLKILDLTETTLSVEEDDPVTGNIINHSFTKIP